MDNKKKRIELPSKDTMLFVANDLCNLGINPSLSKQKILNKVFDFYNRENNILKLIDMLSINAIDNLKKVYESYISGKDYLDEFSNMYYNDDLIDTMIFYIDSITLNKDKYESIKCNELVLKNIGKIFSLENKELINKTILLEEVVLGLLYSYGVMRSDYFLSFVNNYLNTNYTLDELYDLIYTKLYLNREVNRFTIHWKNIDETEEYVSYMNYSDELALVCEEQKNRNFEYNIFETNYLIDRSKKLINKDIENIVDYLKEKNKTIKDDDLAKFVRSCLMGLDNTLDLLKEILKDVDEDDFDECLDQVSKWHNDLNMYSLCGYSPNTIKDDVIVS